MNVRKLYNHIYGLLENVTPINVDCGRLCGSVCCKGDKDTGMYLFPFEEYMYEKKENWFRICDSDFLIDEKPVKIFICNGFCKRNMRPLSCRIFPLFYIGNELKPDMRANSLCPLVYGKIELSEYSPEFVSNLKKVFNILNKFNVTKKYIKETEKLIYEQDFFKKQ